MFAVSNKNTTLTSKGVKINHFSMGEKLNDVQVLCLPKRRRTGR